MRDNWTKQNLAEGKHVDMFQIHDFDYRRFESINHGYRGDN